jgi:hypothetical protein
LLAAAEQYARERDGEMETFTKHAATFLNRDDGPWLEAYQRRVQALQEQRKPPSPYVTDAVVETVDVDALNRKMNERRLREDEQRRLLGDPD